MGDNGLLGEVSPGPAVEESVLIVCAFSKGLIDKDGFAVETDFDLPESLVGL